MPATQVSVKRLFLALKLRPEDQTEGGHHRRRSPPVAGGQQPGRESRLGSGVGGHQWAVGLEGK